MADIPIDCDFPVWGLLPKKETGVVSFLNKYEEYDGRNTVIAILDSGVDPAAEGLKVTSTGEIKVIERFDCSGCGDVDTTTIRKVVDGVITGLTGRKLKIPESWKNPSGEWRVGMLYPYSLYPTKLKERMQAHRKENIWDISHKSAFAEANKKLQEFEAEIAAKNSSSLTLEEKAKKDELEARVDVLQNAEKKYNDVGPTYDCVLFNDGEVWRACIDTSECGELTRCALLGEYSITHEHTHLTPIDEMTISVNVHDKGDVLEVVGMCSTHGTHVAAIAAGYFPEEPDKNGVAPGARVVSLTIGDSRLGSMETGTALVRACVKIMELSATTKVDVVNMSYGEHAHWSNAGRVGSVICSVVNGYGVSWVVSGGNHGPALCTVGAPPDVAQSVLVGVGAYVSADMMAAAYSMRARAPAGAFSWSSRGPCADGALGVSVCAPGGAVASVARFTLRNCQLMNGTSMAAPHVAGVAALLVSGLKARRLPYSPYSVKRALENSATFLPHVEPWAQGAGLVNVEKAFEILSAYHDAPERDVSFGVTCGVYGGKGVLLRPTDDAPRDVTVTVEPQFQRAPPSAEADAAVIATQLALRLRLTLTCAASWVSTPKHLDMMNASRPFVVRIDVASLPPGPHFASIDAYDVSCVEKGPVFRVPVTVLKAEPLAGDAGTPRLSCQRVVFRPGAIRRHLIAAPAAATWGVVRMQRSGGEAAGRFLLHALQMLPRRSCRSHETQKLVTLSAEAPAVTPFQVRGDALLEVAIAKYWASTGDVEVDYSIELFGVRPDFGPRLSFHAAEGIREVCVRTLRLQEVQPSVQLKHMEAIIRPSESKLAPLSPRDVVPPSRQIYQLLNTYSFHLAKATEVSPMVTMLNDMLYESEFESQMWMLYNSCKQLMAVGDAYPSKYSVKLEKGEYVVRVSIRHEQRQQLERLQELPLVVQQRLAQPLALDVYASQSQALVAGKKFSPVLLPAGVSLPLYVAAAPVDKITRSCLTLGHTLSGTMSFAKDEAGRKVDTYPIQYVVCEMPRRNNNNNSVAGNNKPKSQEDFSDAYKDFVTGWLPKLEGENLEQVYAEAVERFPEYAGVHVAYLNALDSPTDPAKLPRAGETPDAAAVNAQRIIAIADKVVQQIELAKVLAQQGAKHDARPDAAKARQEQERARAQLLDALCRRGTALCRSGASAAALHDNATDVLKLADLSDSKVIQYGVWHYFTLEQWGRAIKLLNKMQEERPSKETEERLIEAYRKLGWDYLAHYSEASIPIRFPSSYRPF